MKTLPEKSTSMRPFSRPRKTSRAAPAVRGGPGAAAPADAADVSRRRGGSAGRPGSGRQRCRRPLGSAPVSERPGHRRLLREQRDGLTGRSGLRPGASASPAAVGSGPGGFVLGGALRPRRRATSAGRGGRVRRSPRPRPQPPLQPLHHQVGAGLPVLVDRVLVAVQPLVDRAEVEVDLRVALRSARAPSGTPTRRPRGG